MSEAAKPLLLHDAARRGDVSAIKDLLTQSPGASKERDPETGNTALHEAALAGHAVCVEALLPHCIPQMVNMRKQTALCIASAAGDLRTVKAFFKNKSTRKCPGLVRRSMRVASTSDIVLFLSTVIPNIAEMRKGGRMALLAAAEDGRADTVKGLLHIGVEPRKARKDGRSAAMRASENGHVDCLRLLLDSGINIVETDWQGQTVLHKAALKGSAECIELLVARGANLHARDRYKMTPLHIAAKQSHTQCVQMLLQLGADRLQEDKLGQTPLELARLNCCQEVINLLTA